jgi:HD superfamily phosphohydrolase
MSQFRDPVHGFIYVSDEEQKIIDSAPFQRLRNIHQLATTYLVYHGAEHSRFGHSIGVMHLVTRAFDSIFEKTPNLFKENSRENEAVAMWYRQILRLIALVHDLGHAPFSHASEQLFPESMGHENYTKKIIEETEIAEYIKDIGKNLHRELGERLCKTSEELTADCNIQPITPQLLWMIYGEKPRIPVNKENADEDGYIWPDFVFLKSFMDGELDCDKMDYLLRDSLYCGVSYGKYDLDRFISTLIAYTNRDEKVLSLAISSGGIQAFEEFVLARYFMFIQVYFHKTRRYFDRLLIECLQEILPEGKYPEKINEYLEWDDIRIVNQMRCSDKDVFRRFLNRDVWTCIFETPAHTDSNGKKVAKLLFDNVKERFPNAKFQFDEVDKKAHKLLPTVYSPDTDSNEDVKVMDRHTNEIKNVMDYSLILKGIIEKIYVCRIYAKGENIDEIHDWINDKYLILDKKEKTV